LELGTDLPTPFAIDRLALSPKNMRLVIVDEGPNPIAIPAPAVNIRSWIYR
jgi:hypothetical protein